MKNNSYGDKRSVNITRECHHEDAIVNRALFRMLEDQQPLNRGAAKKLIT